MATQRRCPRGQPDQVVLQHPPDLVASKAVSEAASGVVIEAASEVASAAPIVAALVEVEEGLVIKVEVGLEEEAVMLAHPLALVTALLHPPMLLLALVEIEEVTARAGMAVVGTLELDRLQMARRTAQPMVRTARAAVGMVIQDAVAHMTIDRLLTEVGAVGALATEEVTAAQEASLAATESR